MLVQLYFSFGLFVHEAVARVVITALHEHVMPRMRRVALPRLAMAVVTAFPIAAGIPGAIFSTEQVSRRPVLAARRCCEGVSTLCAITPGFVSCSFP